MSQISLHSLFLVSYALSLSFSFGFWCLSISTALLVFDCNTKRRKRKTTYREFLIHMTIPSSLCKLLRQIYFRLSCHEGVFSESPLSLTSSILFSFQMSLVINFLQNKGSIFMNDSSFLVNTIRFGCWKAVMNMRLKGLWKSPSSYDRVQ